MNSSEPTKIPSSPGVYEFLDENQNIIYVGKAKNLKKRLFQYKNAKKRKKVNRKMNLIQASASSLRFTECSSEKESLLLENALIQKFRPKFNVAGAFSFLYPYLGYALKDNCLYLIYTTSPEAFTGVTFFGAFRSRKTTRECFLSLAELFSYIAHREKKIDQTFPKIKFSSIMCFRQIQFNELKNSFDDFLSGKKMTLLEELFLMLLNKSAARRDAKHIQDNLKLLKKFFRLESFKLRKVMSFNNIQSLSIKQKDRDSLFIKAKS